MFRTCIVALVAAFFAAPLGASADRFGPPFMDRVTAEQTTLYTSLDRSQVIGPLATNAIVVVLDQKDDMVRVPEGWVPATDLAETTEPWVAEVSEASASVYAYPDAHASIRKTAQQGDLLRVTGVSHAVADDTSMWWSTTEGYVALHSIRAATSDWARAWSMPSGDLALTGWWGRANAANVRVGPSSEAPMPGWTAGLVAEPESGGTRQSTTGPAMARDGRRLRLRRRVRQLLDGAARLSAGCAAQGPIRWADV